MKQSSLPNRKTLRLKGDNAYSPVVADSLYRASTHLWTPQMTTVQGTWDSVCWSKELRLFVAVSNSLTNGPQRVATSPNGVTWTLRATPSYAGWGKPYRCVAYSPELQVFLALGTSIDYGEGPPPPPAFPGPLPSGWMYSTDGVTWDEGGSILGREMSSVCWAKTLSDGGTTGWFCGVSDGGSNHEVFWVNDVSGSGVLTNSLNLSAWRSVCWSPELGTLCAVAGAGPDVGRRIMTTSVAKGTWNPDVTGLYNYYRNSVCWSPELRIFCAVGDTTTDPIGYGAIISTDGLTWTPYSTPAGFWNSVCWSSELRRFIATGAASSGYGLMTSPDGITWTEQPTYVVGSYGDNIGNFLYTIGPYPCIAWSPETFRFAIAQPAGLGAFANNTLYISVPKVS